MIDPISFIETRKEVILINLEENPICEGFEIIERLKEFIYVLAKLRLDRSATEKYLNSKISKIEESCQGFFEVWLLKTIEGDKSYDLTFNCLVNRLKNKTHRGFWIKPRKIDLDNIGELIKAENEESRDESTNQIGKSPKLIGFDYIKHKPLPEKAIKKIYSLLKRENIIDGKLNNFLNIFGEEGEISAPMEWILITKRTKRLNKESLLTFLEIMFGGLPKDVMNIAPSLFVDNQGEWLRPEDNIKDRKIKNLSTKIQLENIVKFSRLPHV